jgi:hypothetical protein
VARFVELCNSPDRPRLRQFFGHTAKNQLPWSIFSFGITFVKTLPTAGIPPTPSIGQEMAMTLSIVVLSLLGIIAVAELVARLGSHIPRRPQPAAPGKHAGWYCFFRIEDLTGRAPRPAAPAPAATTARRRPRPVLQA